MDASSQARMRVPNPAVVVLPLVTAAQAGTYENAIAPWDTYSQDAGSATAEAAATLQVGVASEIPTASDTALMAMAFLMALAAWRVLKT